MKHANYPISTNGKQCLGPCNPANTIIRHPITLEDITSNTPFCPVDKFVFTQDGKTTHHIIDNCSYQIATQNDNQNLVIPNISFYSDYFVKVYYGILSIEDAIDWLAKHANAPYRTKERVFINSMITFGDTLNIVDVRLAEFISVVMNKHIRNLYKKLRPYMQLNDDSVIKFNKNETKQKTDTDEEMLFIYAYIKNKFLTTEHIIGYLSNFIRNYKSYLVDANIVNILIDRMSEYIIKNIK